MERKNYIKRKEKNQRSSLNDNFNQCIDLVVREMFQNERVDRYLPIQLPKNGLDEELEFSFVSGNGSVLCTEKVEGDTQTQKFSKLSQYERLILSNLLYGRYHTYALCGGMGSGKTSTSKFILREVQNHLGKDKVLIISINFNIGFLSKNKEYLMKEFFQVLYEKLRVEIEAIFYRDEQFDHFLQYIGKREHRKRYSAFVDYLDSTFSSDYREKSIEEKVRNFFFFIKNQSPDKTVQIRLLYNILNYIKEVVLGEKGSLIIFFDNIDWLMAEAQFEILDKVVHFAEGKHIRCLINMRRSTFRRFTSRSAFVFGVIHHFGPQPTRVIEERINYWLKNWDSEVLIQNLNPDYRASLKSRLVQMKDELHNHQDFSFGEMIKRLSGKSIRLALELVTRVLVNNVIPWDQSADNKNSLARAILLGKNSEMVISSIDPYLFNVFELAKTGTGDSSLLILRILSLIRHFKKEEAKRRTSYIYSILKRIGRWDEEDYVNTINSLLVISRPLVWTEGSSFYNSFSEMLKENDVLHLTEIGDSYFSKLTINLRYVQEAFMSVRWNTDSVPNEMGNSFFERMKCVRLCLQQLMDQDREEIELFEKWHKERDKKYDFEVFLISNRILYNIAKSFIQIAKSRYKSNYSFDYDEFENWHSTVINAFNKEPKNYKLEGLIEEFKFIGRVR